jgi:hypothetical protein
MMLLFALFVGIAWTAKDASPALPLPSMDPQAEWMLAHLHYTINLVSYSLASCLAVLVAAIWSYVYVCKKEKNVGKMLKLVNNEERDDG